MVGTGRWYQTRGCARFRLSVVALFLIFTLAMPCMVQASSSTYLHYRHWQPYDWPENRPSANEVSRSQRGLGWQKQGASGTFGIDYDYQPIRIRNGEPAHNGHLHRLTFGGEWQRQLYRVEARAGVAGTSNMFKYQDFHSDVLNGRIALFRAVDQTSGLSFGIGGDHRFGSFRWLPRARWEKSNDRGHWTVDLPVLLQWQSPGRLWKFRLERNGDRWATLDKAREVESALYLQAWRMELSYPIHTGAGSWLAARIGIGASFDTRVRYEALDTGMVKLNLSDALLASLRFDW